MADEHEIQVQAGRVFERTILIITGLTRPGTAWVGGLIDAHPQGLCSGELHLADHLMPLVDGALAGYNVKSREMTERLVHAGYRAQAPRFADADLAYVTRDAASLILSRLCGGRIDDYACIADRTPEAAYHLERLIRVIPEIRVVHVVRDGRDEAAVAWEFGQATGGASFRKKFPTFGAFVKVFAENWGAATGAARRFGRSYWDRYLEVHWENLMTDPFPGVHAILEFAGLDADHDVVSQCLNDTWAAAPPGGRVGFGHPYFDERALNNFDNSAGELLKLLGYK